MNKRQRKKQFKKIYGINPKKAADDIRNSVNTLLDAIPKMIKTACDAIANFAERVRTMPDDEFDTWLNNPELTQEQKRLLFRLRNGR